MQFWQKFLLVFISMILTDIVWGIYIKSVSDNNAFKAGLFSCLIMGFGSFVTLNYVGDHRLLMAAVLGAFIGTFGIVLYNKRKIKKDLNENSTTRNNS